MIHPLFTPFLFHFLISSPLLSLSLSLSVCAMSIIHEKSPKHCAEKQVTKYHKSKKKLFIYTSTFFLSILSLILLLWLFLHPRNPHFSLTHANISHLNITLTPTLPSFLNSSIHLTLLSTNPNKNVGIYYDRFLVRASYTSHVITPQASIPPFYQDHHETNLLSASLLGNRQPVDPSLAYRVRHDQATGKLAVDFEVTGWLRWKLGIWISRKYRFNVDCATVLPLGRKVSTALSSKQGIVCSTSI